MPEIFDRARRLELEMPVVARAAGSDDAPAESSVTINVSSGGVCFEVERRPEVGAHLDLEFTLPEALRHHFGGESVYRTRAVVYRVEPADGQRHRVIARFADDGRRAGPASD